MPMYGPNTFEYQSIQVHHTTRPAASQGTRITPSATANTYGSYIQIFSSVDYDTYGIYLRFTNGATSGQNRDTLITIGVDPAGGSSYTDYIPDLLVGCPAQFNASVGYGMNYWFPLFIPAGASVAAKSQVNAASALGPYCNMILYQNPRYPEAVPVGNSVTAYGANQADSGGTAVTGGTTSEGAWTSLGAASGEHWYWALGYAHGVTAATVRQLRMDIGVSDDATNYRIVLDNVLGQISNAEQTSMICPETWGFARPNDSGDTIYARCQAVSSTPSGFSMAAYGVS